MDEISKATGKKIGCVGHDCNDCQRGERAAKREARELRKAMKHLSDTVLVFLHRMDEQVGPDKKIPSDTGRLMAAWANDLDMVNDGVRYNHLGVDFRKDDKTRAVAKLLRSNAEVSRSAPLLAQVGSTAGLAGTED